jgi:hypothetical protein
MPQRIPIKIFKLVRGSDGRLDVAPTRYLQGVTADKVFDNGDGTQSIDLGERPVGQPLAASTPTRVYLDFRGQYVILGGAEKLYIPTGKPEDKTYQVFTFYVNPQRLTPTYQKLHSEIRTRGGWEVQHWGDALTDLTIDGVSGGTHRRSTVAIVSNPNDAVSTKNITTGVDGIENFESITNTKAWNRLVELRQLYDVDHAVRNRDQLSLLGISVYDTFYVGYFTGFTGPVHDAEKPFQFSYSFTMKILNEMNVSSLSPSIRGEVAVSTQTMAPYTKYGN